MEEMVPCPRCRGTRYVPMRTIMAKKPKGFQAMGRCPNCENGKVPQNVSRAMTFLVKDSIINMFLGIGVILLCLTALAVGIRQSLPVMALSLILIIVVSLLSIRFLNENIMKTRLANQIVSQWKSKLKKG